MSKELDVFVEWFEALPKRKDTGGLPARGSIAAALVVLERLKGDYQLDLESHLAFGRAQIKGLNPKSVQKILSNFDENRPFSGEGGRTNRGAPGDIRNMLQSLKPLRLEEKIPAVRNAILTDLQDFLVGKVREFHNRKRLELTYDAGSTTWVAVHELLKQAEQVNKGGPVAQYLVGAKLQLRFPELQIPKDRYSAADDQTGRLGDFQIGDTAFHVTVAPFPAVYEKCRRNLNSGARVYLLIPDKLVIGARQLAESAAPGKIAVESLESFIANNIEELSMFDKRQIVSGFRRLLEEYNRRVDAIELDKSLLIEIPPTLQ